MKSIEETVGEAIEACYDRNSGLWPSTDAMLCSLAAAAARAIEGRDDCGCGCGGCIAGLARGVVDCCG